MVEAMKVNEKAAYSMLTPKRVVQLPDESNIDLEDLTCTAILSVATAWKVWVCTDNSNYIIDALLIVIFHHVMSCLQRVEEDVTNGIMKSAAVTGAMVLCIITIHPCDIGYIVSFLSIHTIEELLRCLDNLSCPSAITSSVSLSHEQYTALVDIYLMSSFGPVSLRVKQLFVSLDNLLACSSDTELSSTFTSTPAATSLEKVSSVSDFYGRVDGGGGMFLRRLQSLGWKQALLFRDTSYLPPRPAASTADASTDGDQSCGSPFCHPVIAAVVHLEESLRVSSRVKGEEEGEAIQVDVERIYITSMELLRDYNSIMKKRYSNSMGEMKSDQELQEEEEREAEAAAEDSGATNDTTLDVLFAVEEAISKFEKVSKSLEHAESGALKGIDFRAGAASSKIALCGTIFASFLIER
jgi:hypothetical protein